MTNLDILLRLNLEILGVLALILYTIWAYLAIRLIKWVTELFKKL